MKKKKPPYGISNYESLITDNYYFVDKTKYIEILEEVPEKSIFFLRPRKFGKSLFVSMLQYYYGVEYKNKFDSLFGEFYIGKNPTKKANKYYVLVFDFSGIDTSNNGKTIISFHNKILDGIKAFNNSYKSFTEQEIRELATINSSADLMTNFLRLFESKIPDKTIFVLIDEYDHFTNELISFRLTEFKDIVSGNGYVRKFYEAIKTASRDGIVDRFFATGVTPVTLDSLTSGFNIAKDFTLDRRFNEMQGFTPEEVKSILEYYEIENSDEVSADLERLYNGSLFSFEADTRIYNSNMVLYFLSEYIYRGAYPKKLIDNNIASDYSKIKNIFYLNNSPVHREKLNEIITIGETTGLITEKYSFEREFTPDDFVSLLFYNGMLTIKGAKAARIEFCIPNYVIKEIYWNFFASQLKENIQIALNTDKIITSLEDLAYKNNMQGWMERIEDVMELLSNRDLQKFDEKYVKMLFITLAAMSQLYIIKSEAEIKGEYPDLMYLYRKPYKPNYQFLIELKYLKKSEEGKLKTTMEAAVQQAKKYLAKPEVSQLENLEVYGVVFVGKKGHFEEVTK